MSTKSHALRLTRAAEAYEEAIATGELRADAFRIAQAVYRGLPGRAPKAPAPVPGALTAFVEAIVRSLATHEPARVLGEVTKGKSRVPYYVRIREEAAWRCHQVGWSHGQIAQAMGRERTSMLTAIERFEARLRSDDLLRARVTRTMVRPPEWMGGDAQANGGAA